MNHPLVSQLRFTRSEFLRAVKGVADDDARQRILPMNCISWNIGHLAWHTITSAADPWLDTLTSARLQKHVISNGRQIAPTCGNLLQRVIYHYWYHIGENLAIRQQLGHTHLPQFVGAIDSKAPYRPEKS